MLFVLYQYKISSGLVWKTFGKGKVQPKYEGEISTGIPDGVGILSDVSALNLFSEIGVILLLFVIGIEFPLLKFVL